MKHSCSASPPPNMQTLLKQMEDFNSVFLSFGI